MKFLLLLFLAQVVIGGKNKYLINGLNATNTRVQDLFCSVGLNVNNPHFLIMQVLCAKKSKNLKSKKYRSVIKFVAGQVVEEHLIS